MTITPLSVFIRSYVHKKTIWTIPTGHTGEYYVGYKFGHTVENDKLPGIHYI
jgi:hypothetical protein